MRGERATHGMELPNAAVRQELLESLARQVRAPEQLEALAFLPHSGSIFHERAKHSRG
jgi:hypothetical protein